MSSQPTTPSGSRIFVGREAELRTLDATFLSAKKGRVANRVCVIAGMAGVGKSYLVEKFVPLTSQRLPLFKQVFLTNDAEFIDPNYFRSSHSEYTLNHIENVDSESLAHAVAELVRKAPLSSFIISGRFRGLGRAAGWAVIDLQVPSEEEAIDQLFGELRVGIEVEELRVLSRALGNLPLALHIAAEYLNTGISVESFLRRFRRTGLGLKLRDPADPLLAEDASRATVSTSIALSLKSLEKSFGTAEQSLPWMMSFARLGMAPVAGFDEKLGAAIAGLREDDFDDLMDRAAQISLVEKANENEQSRRIWCLHPLVAQLLQFRLRQDPSSRAADIPETQALGSRARTRASRLSAISVRNFKSISVLDLDIDRISELPGNWLCIAGINGAGKSALLQAMALVLLGDRLSLVVGDKWLDRARRRTGDKAEDAEIRATVKIGEETLELVLPIGAGRIDLEKVIPDADQRKKIKDFWDERERDHLLLSYGAGRNLSEYVDSRHGTKSDEVRRQMTLFDPLTQVTSVEVLLKQAPEHAPILALLKRLLSVILEDTALVVAPIHESLRFLVDGALVEAAELPDGFRATIAWLADLCAAWCAKAPHEAASGDPSQIRAIVLIDEIDLHLHPSLQRVLVPRLRKALPEVQWIVTTHSPLVLSSFDKSELVLLDIKAPGGVRLLDRQILGFTMDEVYEWLMGTEPQSAVLDEIEGEPHDAEARLARILAQSPTVSEEKARENEEWRSQLVETMRQKDEEDERP